MLNEENIILGTDVRIVVWLCVCVCMHKETAGSMQIAWWLDNYSAGATYFPLCCNFGATQIFTVGAAARQFFVGNKGDKSA
jgi:hypothetical protein